MSLVAIAASIALGHAQIDPNIVIWRTYKAGTQSKAQDQRILVLDTLGDYQRYINDYHPEGAGDGRDIDWNKEELVAIHVGTRNTGGYSVEVSSIKKVKPNEAQVAWAELTPVKGVAVTQALTSPWTIVRLNRPGAKLTFSGRKEEGRLPGGIQIINFPGYDWGCSCCRTCVKTQANRLPWRVYASGDDAPTLTATSYVMSSEIEFGTYTKNFQMSGLGDGSDIDWRIERLVAIHLGRKAIPGYQLLVNHVDIIDSRRVDVSYLQVEPGSKAWVPNGITGPYLVVRIPRVGSLVTVSKQIVHPGQRIDLDTCSCGCESCRHCGGRGG